MLSIVVPVFNEEEGLQAFFDALTFQLEKLKEKYEIIFVDDGSTDTSLQILKDLAKKDNTVQVFSFRKNQGKAEALTLGFQKAQGEQVLTMDADLQDKPSEIYKFLEKAKNGTEVVCGWRKDRKDKSKMKIISKIFNYFMNKLYGLDIHDYNCGFKLYTKDAAKSLRLYGGLHRFIPLLVSQNGFSVDEIPVEHDVRKYGKSKYGFSKLWTDLPDMFTMLFLVRYGKRPLHFFGTIGLTLFGIGGIIFVYLASIWFMGESIGRRPLLQFSILLMLGGLQIFFTGFIAELLISLSNREYQAPALKYRSDTA